MTNPTRNSAKRNFLWKEWPQCIRKGMSHSKRANKDNLIKGLLEIVRSGLQVGKRDGRASISTRLEGEGKKAVIG